METIEKSIIINAPAEKVFDMPYPELIADPVRAVERIHEQFALPFDEVSRAAVQSWLRDRPQHHFGEHTYSPEELGLSAEQIRARFSAYTERFLPR